MASCSQYLRLYSYRCSGEVTSCSHELRLYWHRLLRSRWRLAVTSWGSSPGDVFQSLAEAQVQVPSCSHYLRLCLHRLLRLGWCFAVTSWGYACIGCSGLCDVLQSLSETMFCIGYSGLGDVPQSLSEAILVNVRVTKKFRAWKLNSMITSVYLKQMPVQHFLPLCSGLAWLLL